MNYSSLLSSENHIFHFLLRIYFYIIGVLYRTDEKAFIPIDGNYAIKAISVKCCRIFVTFYFENGMVAIKHHVQGYPYKVLISPEGTVLNAYLGETEEFYQYIDSTLEQ